MSADAPLGPLTDGATTRYIIPFEALLVRQDARWLIVMERQFAAADEAAWNAMAP